MNLKNSNQKKPHLKNNEEKSIRIFRTKVRLSKSSDGTNPTMNSNMKKSEIQWRNSDIFRQMNLSVVLRGFVTDFTG